MADLSKDQFKSLPIETNQQIASYLDSDSDLCSFRLQCHATDDAVNADGFSFWRMRFLTQFEKPAWKATGKKLVDNLKYKEQYQLRKRALKNGAVFKAGEGGKEKICLSVLRELMLEMYSEKKPTDDKLSYVSANLDHIIKFVGSTNILNCMLRRCTPPPGERHHTKGSWSPATPLLYAIQVMLAPAMLSLNPHLIHDGFAFPDSQRSVYGTKEKYPIFTGVNGLDLNMEWCVHQLNFWKYHMLRREECTLHPAFEALEDFERPHFWLEKLRQGTDASVTKAFGKHWKGSYSYIERDDMEDMRRGFNDDGQIQDIFNGEFNDQAFQDLRLDFGDKPNPICPPMFDTLLGSFQQPETKVRTRAQKRSAQPDEHTWSKPQSFRFDGSGQDEHESFLASGYLNNLPPQSGIPGFKRMTLLKYFENSDGSLDGNSFWCYEGVVLPGGQMMFGRWWCPYDGTGEDVYSGPFIMWAVDALEVVESKDVEMEGAADGTASSGL